MPRVDVVAEVPNLVGVLSHVLAEDSEGTRDSDQVGKRPCIQRLYSPSDSWCHLR